MSQPPAPQPTKLHLIRHGEVEDRYHHVFGGRRIDMELSALGHRQARALAKYLESTTIDAFYASPMKRAQQTAAPIAEYHKATPITIPDLAEVDFGDWTGLNWQQLEARYGYTAYEWLDKLEHAQVPGGETGQLFRQRVEPCLHQILRDHPGQSVVVVCHGGVIRMILSILLKLPLPRMSLFDVEYAGLTVVDHQPLKTKVHLLNLVPWRDLK